MTPDYEPMDAEKLTELAGGVRDVTRIVRLFHQSPMTAHATHVVTGGPAAGFMKHWPECSCGWSSTSAYPTAEIAAACAQDHVRLATWVDAVDPAQECSRLAREIQRAEALEAELASRSAALDLERAKSRAYERALERAIANDKLAGAITKATDAVADAMTSLAGELRRVRDREAMVAADEDDGIRTEPPCACGRQTEAACPCTERPVDALDKDGPGCDRPGCNYFGYTAEDARRDDDGVSGEPAHCVAHLWKPTTIRRRGSLEDPFSCRWDCECGAKAWAIEGYGPAGEIDWEAAERAGVIIRDDATRTPAAEPERWPIVTTAYGALPVGTRRSIVGSGPVSYWVLSEAGWCSRHSERAFRTMHTFLSVGEILEPLAHDALGWPIYAGDTVEFVREGERRVGLAEPVTCPDATFYVGDYCCPQRYADEVPTIRKVHSPEPTA